MLSLKIFCQSDFMKSFLTMVSSFVKKSLTERVK